MKNFHLIGQSIQTSLSPEIHNYLFKLKGHIKCQYSIYPKQNHLLSLLDLEKQNISGISITIPFKQSYKQQILNGSLGTLSITKIPQNKQEKINKKTAQNTLYKRFIINTIRKNSNSNKLLTKSSFDCFNTDIFGIKQCIKKNKNCSSLIKNIQSTSSSTKAIIIGGGATAETFMSYFEQNSIKMIIINRSVQKIQKLQQDGYYPHIQKVMSFEENENNSKKDQNLFQDIHNLIVINTLPTSIMRENILQHEKNSFKKLLSSKKLDNIFYMDVNYRDSEESLLKAIISYTNQNLKIHRLSTGLDMLVWQGIMQNYLFCEQDTHNEFQQVQFDQQFVKIMAKLKQLGKY